MLQTPPPFTPQQRIDNDFSQFPRGRLSSMMLKALRGPQPQVYTTPGDFQYQGGGHWKGIPVASNVLPIPGMAGQAPAWQPTDDQLMRGENLSKHPNTGVLPFPIPNTAALTNIYMQNPPRR